MIKYFSIISLCTLIACDFGVRDVNRKLGSPVDPEGPPLPSGAAFIGSQVVVSGARMGNTTKIEAQSNSGTPVELAITNKNASQLTATYPANSQLAFPLSLLISPASAQSTLTFASFQSTGITDNATRTVLTVAAEGRLQVQHDSAVAFPTPGPTAVGSLHIVPSSGAPGASANGNSSAITFGANTDDGPIATAQAGIYTQTSSAFGSKMFFATTNNYTTGAQTRMTIDPEGRVGIGVSSPIAALDLAGVIRVTTPDQGIGLVIDGTAVCFADGCILQASDQRLKENIQPLTSSYEKIIKLKGVSYNWKDKKKYARSPRIGLIAQDLEKVYPEVVKTDPNSGLKHVAFGNLIGPLIEAFKTMADKVGQLEKKLKETSVLREVASREQENFEKIATSLKEENAALKNWICGKDPAASFCKNRF